MAIQITIDRSRVQSLDGIDWPPGSYSLYMSQTIDPRQSNMYFHIRYMPDVSEDDILFLRLQGYKVSVVSDQSVITVNGKYTVNRKL